MAQNENRRRRPDRGNGKKPRREQRPGHGRSGGADPQRKGRRDLKGEAQNLPRWVVDDLTRVTQRERVGPALEALAAAGSALSEGRHHVAVKHAQRAKALAPRDATVRETLALAAYRVGDWQTALSELRTYRRLSGETTHLPVEMDALRALDRPRAVDNAWEELRRRGAKPAVMKEGLVVYASFLIDQGEPERAYHMTTPGRIPTRAYPQDLRVWYVAAKAAAMVGKVEEAEALRNAILEADPAFPGIDDLESIIATSGR